MSWKQMETPEEVSARQKQYHADLAEKESYNKLLSKGKCLDCGGRLLEKRTFSDWIGGGSPSAFKCSACGMRFRRHNVAFGE